MTAPDLTPEAIAARQVDNKIEAIKLTRESTGVELKPAKDAVERYLHGHPELQEQFTRQSSTAKSLLSWLFMMIVAIAAIVYFWPRR